MLRGIRYLWENRHRTLCILLCLSYLGFFCNTKLSAQYYTIGTDPSSSRWNILESNNFRIIYPRETDSLAREYLFAFERTRGETMSGLKIDPDKIPLILHPYTSQSNATVVWAPKRVDIITTPPAYSSYADGWIHQLAVHEGRHVGQMTHYTKGVFKWLYYIIGEQSAGLGVGFYPSRWFLEGDAVMNETDFSSSGRGRDPNFLMFFRASFLDGEYRKYDSWRYGSYKYYTPDKYSFGYLTESAIRFFSCNYTFAGDIMSEFVNLWYNPGVWNISFQKYTGTTGRKHFRKATEMMTGIWEKDYLSRGKYTPLDTLTKKKERLYTVYSSPMPMANNQVLALKSGFSYPKILISIDSTGKEKILQGFSSYTCAPVKRDDNTFIWTEIIPDIRWELRDYSILRSYNTSTNRIKNITRHTRYYNPAFSPGKDTVSVVEYPVSGSSFLVLLDYSNGKVITKYEAPFKGQLKSQTWIGNTIYAGIVNDNGWSVYKIDTENPHEGWICEIEAQSRVINNMRSTSEGNIIFQTDLDGVTNIYMYSPETKCLQKMTNARFGAFQPTLDEKTNTLYFTDFDAKGYHPVRASLDSLDWRPGNFSKPYKFPIAETLAEQSRLHTTPMPEEQALSLKDSINSIRSKKYRKGELFRIHSWAPVYFNLKRIESLSYDEYYQLASLGFTLLSQNSLGTATSQLGYSYHNGFHSGHVNFNYSGLFPVFELSVDFNDRHRTMTQITMDDGSEPDYPIDEKRLKYKIDTISNPVVELELNTYIPLDLSRSGINSGLVPEFTCQFTNDQYSLFGKSYQYKRNFSFGIRYYWMLPITHIGVFPRYGFGIQVSGAFAHGPHNQNEIGRAHV